MPQGDATSSEYQWVLHHDLREGSWIWQRSNRLGTRGAPRGRALSGWTCCGPQKAASSRDQQSHTRACIRQEPWIHSSWPKWSRRTVYQGLLRTLRWFSNRSTREPKLRNEESLLHIKGSERLSLRWFTPASAEHSKPGSPAIPEKCLEPWCCRVHFQSGSRWHNQPCSIYEQANSEDQKYGGIQAIHHE